MNTIHCIYKGKNPDSGYFAKYWRALCCGKYLKEKNYVQIDAYMT